MCTRQLCVYFVCSCILSVWVCTACSMDDVHLTLSTVVQHSLVPFDCCTWRQRAGRLAAGPHVMAQRGDLFISLFKSTHVVTTSPPAKAQISIYFPSSKYTMDYRITMPSDHWELEFCTSAVYQNFAELNKVIYISSVCCFTWSYQLMIWWLLVEVIISLVLCHI